MRTNNSQHLAVSHGVGISALVCLAIDGIAVPFAYRYDKQPQLLIPQLVNEAKSGRPELDLVASRGPGCWPTTPSMPPGLQLPTPAPPPAPVQPAT